MTQKPKSTKTFDQYAATNFSPREWRSVAWLRESQGKNLAAPEFESFLENYDLSRKEFCEIFGVGESTLSGWLSGKGIPVATTHALNLALELDICTEQLRRAAEDLDAARYDARVVQDGNAYSIVSQHPDQPVGAIVAREIPDLETALSLVRSQSLLRTLQKAKVELTREPSRKEYFGYQYRDEILAEVDHQLGDNMQSKGDENG